MNRKAFLLLVILMSLSLIGIIVVQGYWIKSTADDKEQQFSTNARQALLNVSRELQNSEIEDFWLELNDPKSEISDRTRLNPARYFLVDSLENSGVKEFLGEEDPSSSGLVISDREDSLNLALLLKERKSKPGEQKGNDEKVADRQRIRQLIGMDAVEKDILRTYIAEVTSKIPIRERVSEEEITSLLTTQLTNYNIEPVFEYAVYSNSAATRIRSDDFSPEHPDTYAVPLFIDASGISDFQLLVNFTGKQSKIISSALMMGALSVLFTLIIVVAYSSSLSQLIKQRQISQIKTDFINNMTHEFKTPIATINLALDAIRNPKIISDQEKVSRYLHMIREENKRMHAQVENVLQISKLEKNELNLKKERLHLHELIEEAVTHVELIVENRGGYIKTHFGALKSSILANQDHMINVIVNILDNAIKYSLDEPKIDIYTENVKNYVILKIRDQGVGMAKTTQKKIFEKFYREHTGDIHNVKGHGLGLAYTKRILEDHHATISVESDKGKGSTFIIKLPLIT